MKEAWVDIKNYEGLYQISSLGEVKSLKRNTTHERILIPRIDRNGYLYVILCKNGITKTKKIHRLVAENFIENPENKYSVNHKDGNKLNNCVDNLEWATMKEQARHAVDNGLWVWTETSKEKLRNTMIKKGLNNITNHKKNHPCGMVKVVQKNDDGDILKIWNSISDASRELSIPVSHIVRVCKGRRKHSRGYIWEYYKSGGDE